MPKYVALLRGIGPMNPNMRNEKLRGVCEDLGFSNVATVISSGNVLFETPRTDAAALEALLEKAWPEQLGFTSTTIIRSRQQLQKLVDLKPFEGYQHSKKTALAVTFFNKPPTAAAVAAFPKGRGYAILGLHGHAICSVVDLTAAKTPDLMAQLERHFGKQITTRTWKTVERILAKLG